MKAAWLSPLLLVAVACCGTDTGPRGVQNEAGAAGAPASAGSAPVSGAGTGNLTGGAPSVGSAGQASLGGTAGSGSLGGSGGSVGVVDPGPLVHPDQRTVVYLPSYRGSLATWATKIDYSQVSYLNLCFAEVDAAGNVSYADPTLDAFVAAAHAKGVKVCMAIGGASVIDNGGVYATVLQDGMRDTLVNKLGQY